MQPPAPKELLARAARWEDISRWGRPELGRALRRLGWTYGEIRELIPVPKGTLAGWCRGIDLSAAQVESIRKRTYGSRKGVPVDTQWRRRAQIEQIRDEAVKQVSELIANTLWVAGVVLYWAEGAKTSNELTLANSDPRALRLFLKWAATFHGPGAQFVLRINLHADNDEREARTYWAEQTGETAFYKTFIKPDGTGHRKNSLPHGVCMVRMRRSADAFQRTMAWIDVVADRVNSLRC